MATLHHSHSTVNTACGSQKRPCRRKPRLPIRAVIRTSGAGSSIYFLVHLYRGGSVIYRFDGWLDDTTPARAWLHASGLAFEWRDAHAPKARLIVSDPRNKSVGRVAA